VGFEFFHDLRTGPSPRGAFGGHAPANFLRSPPNDLNSINESFLQILVFNMFNRYANSYHHRRLR